MKPRAAVCARGSLRLPRAHHVAVYAIGIGLWLSGGLWLLFHYFVQHPGPFGPVPNPLEPWWLKLHGAFAFAAIWIFGLLWGVHIVAGWYTGRRRGTGGLLAAVLGWLVVSGYLLYYLGDETLRPLVSLLHWSIGLALPAAFAAHRLAEGHRVRRAEPQQPSRQAFHPHPMQPPFAGRGSRGHRSKSESR
jgi:hypothetical protein